MSKTRTGRDPKDIKGKWKLNRNEFCPSKNMSKGGSEDDDWQFSCECDA